MFMCVCVFVSTATFFDDDNGASCQLGLTEIKQKGRNGEKSDVCICLSLQLGQIINLGPCGSFC